MYQAVEDYRKGLPSIAYYVYLQTNARPRAVATWLSPTIKDSKSTIQRLKPEQLFHDIRRSEPVQGLPGSDRVIGTLPHEEPPEHGLRALYR